MNGDRHDPELEREYLSVIEAYLDGSLDAIGAARLATAVRSGGRTATFIRSRIAFSGLLGQALDHASADDVARAVNERIDAQGESSSFERRIVQALPLPTSRHRPRQPTLMAAALVVLAAAAAWWILPQQHQQLRHDSTCRIMTTVAGTVIERAGNRIDAVVDAPLEAGDVVVTTGPATVQFGDHTTLALGTGSRLRLQTCTPDKRVSLDSGSLDADVAPQPTSHPFIVATPVGRIEVIGTHFVLIAAPTHTRIDLTKGTVRIIRTSDGRSLTMHAGETASIASDAAFVVHPLHPPASLNSGAPPATSRPLFLNASLEGWDQQHGVWNVANGMVHGSGEGAPARLLSQQPFGDLVLTCRLRLHGVDHAEVQVGDYNWFFTVHAPSSDWIVLRLEQQGSHLHCTADGVALVAEAGAGQPARAGPLAFYIMTGTIDIIDARITAAP